MSSRRRQLNVAKLELSVISRGIERERVIKSTVKNLYLVHTWHLNIEPNEFANTFIICGVLYGLHDGHSQHTNITYAYDLYQTTELEVRQALLRRGKNVYFQG